MLSRLQFSAVTLVVYCTLKLERLHKSSTKFRYPTNRTLFSHHFLEYVSFSFELLSKSYSKLRKRPNCLYLCIYHYNPKPPLSLEILVFLNFWKTLLNHSLQNPLHSQKWDQVKLSFRSLLCVSG